jgi:hypothetical protein
MAGLSLAGMAQADEPLTSVASDVRLGTEPVSVMLSPHEALAAALRDADQTPVVLAVNGITGTAAQPIRINVFLDKPDADNRTSPDDSSCLGFIQLLPNQATVRRTGYNFDLSGRRNLDVARPIPVTLVPVVGDNSVPTQVSLRIERIYIKREP